MKWIVAVVLAAALGAPAFAHAADARVFIGGGGNIGQWPRPHSSGGGRVSGHNSCFDTSGKSFCGGLKSQPRNHLIIVPQTIFVAPATSCLIPGHWSSQWVPQTTWYSAWVPGQWSPDGFWVEGHYEQRPWTTYTQQPVWMPERWGC